MQTNKILNPLAFASAVLAAALAATPALAAGDKGAGKAGRDNSRVSGDTARVQPQDTARRMPGDTTRRDRGMPRDTVRDTANPAPTVPGYPGGASAAD